MVTPIKIMTLAQILDLSQFSNLSPIDWRSGPKRSLLNTIIVYTEMSPLQGTMATQCSDCALEKDGIPRHFRLLNRI